jgi:hypothetical protein
VPVQDVSEAGEPAIPFVSWERVAARLKRDFRPGMHLTAIGPNGAGKTLALLSIAELANQWTIVLGTKRRDPLLEALARNGYERVSSTREIMWVEETPLQRRYLVWPQAERKETARERMDFQAARMREALDFADRTTNWLVLCDELHWLSKNLRLEPELSAAYFQGRTQGVSILGAAQRPTHVPLLAYSQASYLLLFQTADERDLDRLAEIAGGFSRDLIARAVVDLDWQAHELLFIDVRRRQLARTVAPARGSVAERPREEPPRARRGGALEGRS